MVKFNATGPAGLIDRKAYGQPPRLNDTHRAALVNMIESGLIPADHEVVRWRIVELCQWIWHEFWIAIARQRLSRELSALDDCKLSARPRRAGYPDRSSRSRSFLACSAGLTAV